MALEKSKALESRTKPHCRTCSVSIGAFRYLPPQPNRHPVWYKPMQIEVWDFEIVKV
jgi:hypothetical protein